MAVLEAKLVITANDQTGAAFKAIEEHVARISAMSKEIGRLSGSASSFSGGASLFSEIERAERAAKEFTTSLRGAAEAVTAISRGFANVDHEADKAKKKVSLLSRAAHEARHFVKEVSPLVMGGAGFGILEETKRAIEAGAELQHERVASANAGRTPEQIAAFERASQDVAAKYPTATYTDSMKTLLETTSAFGSPEHAVEHLGFMMRTAAVLKAAAGGKISESAGEMGQQFAKFFEMRGVANDPRRFESEGDQMVRAMAATGGTFNPREMFMFAQQAKGALRNYDIDYLSRYVPSLVGENGGERAGTAANAFNNVILGKARDAKQAAEWMKYGLLDPKKVDMKKGHVVSWSAGAVKETDLAMTNPLKWFETVALPAMKKHGVDTEDAKELTKALAVMFRNSMSNQWANENAQPADRARLHKDAALYGQTAMPQDMYKRNLDEDPTQGLTALTGAINSFSSALTSPIMKDAAAIMSGLGASISGFAKSLSEWQKANPAAAKVVAGGAVGGGLIAGGALGYGALSGLMGGFGLKGSAAALDQSAAALDAAAARLGAEGHLSGQRPGGSGGPGGADKPMKDLRGRAAFMGVGWLDAMLNMPSFQKNADGSYSLPQTQFGKGLEVFGNWLDSHLPHATLPAAKDMLSGKWSRGTFQQAPSGYSRDFTLGSTGSFEHVGKLVPPSGTAFISDYDLHRVGGRGEIAHNDTLSGMLNGKVEAVVRPDQILAKLDGAVDVSVKVSAQASTELLKLITDARAVSKSGNIKANVGTSLPEAGPAGRNGTGRQ